MTLIRDFTVTEAVDLLRQWGCAVEGVVGRRGYYLVFHDGNRPTLPGTNNREQQHRGIKPGRNADGTTHAGQAVLDAVAKRFRFDLRKCGAVPGIGDSPSSSALYYFASSAHVYNEYPKLRRALAYGLSRALRDIFPSVSDDLAQIASEL